MKRLSLQLRLSLFFIVAIAVTWVLASIFAWYKANKYINEFFDTHQTLFAQKIAATHARFVPHPQGEKLNYTSPMAKGDIEDDAISFAIFSNEGDLLFSDGEKGDKFYFRADFVGFENSPIKDDDDKWRIFWQPSHDGRFIVAVGQEIEHREKIACKLLVQQLRPWLFMLPLLLIGLFIIMRRELAPLRKIKEALEKRKADSHEKLSAENMPAEIYPMVMSLNEHFEKVYTLLERERAFVADAAHELRTPLAGLRIQAEVALLSKDDPKAHQNALNQLTRGIDRCARLTDQLLALSKIEGHEHLEELEEIHVKEVIDEILMDYHDKTVQKEVTIDVVHEVDSVILTRRLQTYMLIRNIIDNAIRYAEPKSMIHIVQKEGALTFENTAKAIDEESFSRLGERFYRPAGQKESGSGLGLTIIKALSAMLGFQFSFEKREVGLHLMQFKVTLQKTSSLS